MKTNEEYIEEFDKQFIIDGNECRIVASYDEDDYEIACWRDYKVKDWLRTTLEEVRREERKDAYEHCAIIREREINDLLFEVMEEAQDTFGNGEKVIKNWMQKNNCEISPLLTPTKTDKQTEI